MVIYIVNSYLNSEFFARSVEIDLYQQLVLYCSPINTSIFKTLDKIGLEMFIYRYHYIGIVESYPSVIDYLSPQNISSRFLYLLPVRSR